MEQELHFLESGQAVHTHARGQCIGQWCAIHQPMPGPWQSWPRLWRDDRGIMERVCSHGVGHPVAEMYEFALRVGRNGMLTHGCCGCPCSPYDQEAAYLERELLSVSEKELFASLAEETGDLIIDLSMMPTTEFIPAELKARLFELLLKVRKLTKETK